MFRVDADTITKAASGTHAKFNGAMFRPFTIGAAAATASAQLDVITVLGFAMFNGFILIVANLVVDILYAVVDPRVRLS